MPAQDGHENFRNKYSGCSPSLLPQTGTARAGGMAQQSPMYYASGISSSVSPVPPLVRTETSVVARLLRSTVSKSLAVLPKGRSSMTTPAAALSSSTSALPSSPELTALPLSRREIARPSLRRADAGDEGGGTMESSVISMSTVVSVRRLTGILRMAGQTRLRRM